MISFDEVVAYITDYDPQFPGAIEGASPGEIAELEALIGGELPEVYRDFLAVMGRNIGWIDVQHFDFRVGTVIEYYRRDSAIPVRRFLRIGSDTKDPSFNPHLQLSYVAPELEVVAFPGCTPATLAEITAGYMKPVAGSMQEMISRPAFRIFEIFGPGRRPVIIRTAVHESGQIDRLESMLLEQYGLQPVFWSSRPVRGYTSPNMAMEVAQLIGRPLEILMRVDNSEEQDRIARALARQLKAQISSPPAP